MDKVNPNEKILEWGFLLLLDSPPELNFGIDNSEWRIGSKFKGVKLIPPGAHLVHYSLKEEGYQFKLGFFIFISKQNRFIVKRWSKEQCDFFFVESEEYERLKQCLENFEFDQYLGAYPLEKYEIWRETSCYIDERVLKKLAPIEKQIFRIQDEYKEESLKLKKNDPKIDFSTNNDTNKTHDINANGQQCKNRKEENIENEIVCEEIPIEDSNAKNAKINAKLEKEQNIQKKEQFQVMGGTIYFTEIPTRKVIHGVQGHSLTQMNLDKSIILSDLLKNEYDDKYEILFGEFQFSFITLLLMESLESLEQWKKIFVLLTSADDLVQNRTQLFVDLVPLLYNQLKQFPKDFFIDAISANNFTYQCLKNFIENGLNCTAPHLQLYKNRIIKLNEMLNKNFQYNVNDNQNIANGNVNNMFLNNNNDDDEDAPMIVEDFNFIKLD